MVVAKASARSSRHRIDFVELVLICGVLLGAMLVMGVHAMTPLLMAEAFTADGVAETRAFERAYGPHRESPYAEEWIIRDFFHDRRNGTFLHSGARLPQINV
jgi:hypothetical protein